MDKFLVRGTERHKLSRGFAGLGLSEFAQISEFFSVLDNRLLADNLSHLQIWSKICIFGHFGPNIGIFGPLCTQI